MVPLVWEKDDGKISVGSGFSFRNGIVTARHCILDPKSLSIKGYTAEELNHSKVIFHKTTLKQALQGPKFKYEYSFTDGLVFQCEVKDQPAGD